MTTNRNYAALMLVVGCVLFGLGSLIVKFVPVGGYAIAFWRLLIASFIFYGLMKWKKQAFPKNRKALWFGIFSGVFLPHLPLNLRVVSLIFSTLRRLISYKKAYGYYMRKSPRFPVRAKLLWWTIYIS